jgi:hypothetical protein
MKSNMTRFCFGALALGGVVSTVFVGGVLLSASPVAREVDSLLNVSTPKEGSSVLRFTEGYAISRFGKHGHNPCAHNDGIDIADTIFLHGDSFIEALQVPDECKPDVVLAKCLGGSIGVIGIGRSGAGFPSMIVRARAYEKAFGAPKYHLFFSANMDNDVFGDEGDEFVRTTDGIVQCMPKASGGRQKMINVINRFHFNCLLSCWTDIQVILRKRWHFLPRFHKTKKRTSFPRQKDLAGELNFLCGEMRKDISAPVIVVYCPSVPAIRHGQIVREDENHVDAGIAKEIFSANGIAMIDVSLALIEHWNAHGGFVRGFSNNLGPSGGHLNAEGIEVVFSEVASQLKERYGL